MFLESLSIRYTLGKNWILRNDPCLPSEYLLFNINERRTVGITKSCYTALKIFEKNAISFETLKKVFEEKKIDFDWEGLGDFCKRFQSSDLLVPSEIPFQNFVTHQGCIKSSRVPVASSPMSAEIHFTHKCNLMCKHCFQDSSPNSHFYHELSKEDWICIFDQLERNKVCNVTISGGEPLYYPYFTELFSEIVNRRMSFSILTNGVLVDNDNVECLSRSNVTLTISLDGPNKEVHDKIRGKGAFDKVVNSIKLLVSHQANISIAYTLNTYNYTQIQSAVEFMYSLGIKDAVFGFTEATGRAKVNNELMLSKEQRKLAENEIKELQLRYQGKMNLRFIDITALKDNCSTDVIYCSAGTTRVGISSDGKLYPCVCAFGHEEFMVGDLTTDNLLDLWTNSKIWGVFRGELKLSQIESCKVCQYAGRCDLKKCRLRYYGINKSLYNRPTECAKLYMNGE